ncbi:translation initiation factor IF-1 [Candidatus Uhrbacteria bacterium]|nr:translation initiation factor IF-1 [Candidatus Uhrbacteria bacterium]
MTTPTTQQHHSPQPQKKGSDFLELRGEVLECLPAATFKVRLENGHEILAYLSGKMRMNRIRLLPGDQVKIEMTPYDVTKGRVTFRY